MSSKHLSYLKYVLRHKFYVAQACFREGLVIRGLIHDVSKFLPSEWFPYVEYFYGEKDKPNLTRKRFDFAWLLHQKRNDHHWQWWVLSKDEGGRRVLPMSDAARKEMVADWFGASRAQGHGGLYGPNGVKAWYKSHRKKMLLHDETRKWVERRLGLRD
ncbi:MAG: hypothetical protein DRP83_00710 [Planctomycetota bacterium]|nr:MAG: hypothetical protein DRP83_00710 [Planctomycetota bacterium]